jgi:response regulator RpfG family c-di-GMP phosphodiesterase
MEQDFLWKQFKVTIDSIVKEGKNSPNYLEHIRFINENNNKLLNYSDEILNEVLLYNNKRGLTIYYSVVLFILIMLMLLAFFIRRAYKDLFIPINQLSIGISGLGVETSRTEGLELYKSEEAPVISEVQDIFDQLNSLVLLMENINQNIPFKDTLNYIFDTFSKYIPYTYIGVALIEDNGKSIRASYAVSGEHHEDLPKKLLGGKMMLNETSLISIVESGKVRIINDLEEYVKGKPLKDYNKVLLEGGIRSSITFPLKNNNEVIGIIFFSSKDKNVYNKMHIRFLKTLANSIVLSLEKDILNQDMVISSTLALAKLTEERDLDTGEHLYRMKTYSRMITEFLAKEEKYKDIIDIDYIKDVERFSPLHDIGKVAIKDEILLKPGKLTFEEFEIMKTHATYGAKVLKMADDNLKKKGRSIFKIAIEIAEGHHEKWDGSGYPYGRKGEEIPLSARIVALADVFDALTSKRPYKRPFTLEETLNIIEEGKGKHFDPFIIEVFIKNLDYIKAKYAEFTKDNIL